MLAIRDAAFAKLGDRDLADLKVRGRPPAFTIDAVQSLAPCGDDGCQEGEDDRLARIVDGTLTVPCYLDKPGCPPGARFFYRRIGDATPSQQPGNVMRTPFRCIVPRAALGRRARISLYGHGLLGSYREVGAGNVRDMAQEHDFVFCATYESGMAEDDVGNASARGPTARSSGRVARGRRTRSSASGPCAPTTPARGSSCGTAAARFPRAATSRRGRGGTHTRIRAPRRPTASRSRASSPRAAW